jgi:hypothetical protein
MALGKQLPLKPSTVNRKETNMKLSIITIILLFAVLLVGTGTVQAETYTGCVTPGGTIVHLAVGESPLKPCKNYQRRIHLDNRDARQNHDVDYNHAKVCEAFWQVGVSPEIMEAMGCPDDPTAHAPGTVQDAYGISFDENDTVCGVLKIEKREEWGPFYHWVIDGRTGDPLPEKGGGFVAAHTQVPIRETGEEDECKNLCDQDPKCIAALHHPGDGTTQGVKSNAKIARCDIFHYSDSVTTGWNDVCGIYGIQACKDAMEALNQRWYVRCEDTLPQLP